MAFFAPWPFVDIWIEQHRLAVIRLVNAWIREDEEHLNEGCFWAFCNLRWDESSRSDTSEESDYVDERDSLLLLDRLHQMRQPEEGSDFDDAEREELEQLGSGD